MNAFETIEAAIASTDRCLKFRLDAGKVARANTAVGGKTDPVVKAVEEAQVANGDAVASIEAIDSGHRLSKAHAALVGMPTGTSGAKIAQILLQQVEGQKATSGQWRGLKAILSH